MRRRKPKPLIYVLLIIAIPVLAVMITKPSNQNTAEKGSSDDNTISDPIYGDGLTEEELEILKEESSEGDLGIVIGEEFTIELDDNQATGGF